MIFFYLITFICQYLYINYIFNKQNPNIVKSNYNYTLNNDNINQTATIYRTNRNAKKVIIDDIY